MLTTQQVDGDAIDELIGRVGKSIYDRRMLLIAREHERTTSLAYPGVVPWEDLPERGRQMESGIAVAALKEIFKDALGVVALLEQREKGLNGKMWQ